jgi:hypothetical protein
MNEYNCELIDICHKMLSLVYFTYYYNIYIYIYVFVYLFECICIFGLLFIETIRPSNSDASVGECGGVKIGRTNEDRIGDRNNT